MSLGAEWGLVGCLSVKLSVHFLTWSILLLETPLFDSVWLKFLISSVPMILKLLHYFSRTIIPHYCHSQTFALQDLSTFFYCCYSIVIIQTFPKIICMYVNFHLLVLFHRLVLHLILITSILKKFNSDPVSFCFCRFVSEIFTIFPMLWNPSDKLLKCLWIIDFNLILNLT